MSHDFDIIIVGGGAVGAALACALKNSKLKIAVIEAVSPEADVQPSFDDRGLSISLSSKNILDNLGLWQNISPHSNPIKRIHVSDQHHFGFVRMDAESMAVPALGHIVLARELGKALIQGIEAADNISFLCPASVTAVEISALSSSVTVNIDGVDKVISSKLLVAADGAESRTRDMLGIKASVENYQQVAIVSNVLPQRPHLDTAYERFTETGPLALLPHSDQRCVLVYTVAENEADKYLQMNEQEFLDALLKRFGRRLGKFSRLGQRKSYPLKMMQVEEQVKHRAVILGNAAHAVHPNGAQGFNLGLRDAVALAEVLIEAQDKNQDIGELSLLESYLEDRIQDQQRVLNFTDRLAKNFYSRQPLKIIARNLVMLATDLSPPLKHRFTRSAMGFWGRQPYLVSRSSTVSKSSLPSG
jgi:2-octaprenyl-6-methoxyphenol hydroxylase